MLHIYVLGEEEKYIFLNVSNAEWINISPSLTINICIQTLFRFLDTHSYTCWISRQWCGYLPDAQSVQTPLRCSQKAGTFVTCLITHSDTQQLSWQLLDTCHMSGHWLDRIQRVLRCQRAVHTACGDPLGHLLDIWKPS